MQIALYVRVSTTRQQQSQTIEQQLERLRSYAATHPEWQITDERIYRDEGFSGAKLNRPGLDRLRDDARAARFACVLITEPDRLARSYVHQILLLDELTQLGCTVEFIDRPMSTDPHDQLVLHIRGAVAEYERTLIADRMRRGRQARMRHGQLLPWAVAPYGYVLDADHPRDPQGIRVHPVTSVVVQQIFAWFTDPQAPMTLYQVAKQLTVAQIPTPRGKPRWNPSTVRAILRSPLYYGMAADGRTRPVPARRRKSALEKVGPGISTQPTEPDEWIMIPVPAIVSRAVFDVAQTRLEQNKQRARRNNTRHDYLLRSLVSCGRCHLTCSAREVSPGYTYYVCAGRSNTLRRATGERCYARYVPAQALDEVVWQDLCRVLREPALLTHELVRAQGGEWLPQALQAQRKTVQQALAHLERQHARLLEVYLAEVIEREEFERKRHDLSQTQAGLQAQLRQLDAQAQQALDLIGVAEGVTAFSARVAPTLEHLDFTQRRQLIELLIDRLIVADGAVEIRYVMPTGSKGEVVPFCHLRLDYFSLKARAITASVGTAAVSLLGMGTGSVTPQCEFVPYRALMGGPVRQMSRPTHCCKRRCYAAPNISNFRRFVLSDRIVVFTLGGAPGLSRSAAVFPPALDRSGPHRRAHPLLNAMVHLTLSLSRTACVCDAPACLSSGVRPQFCLATSSSRRWHIPQHLAALLLLDGLDEVPIVHGRTDLTVTARVPAPDRVRRLLDQWYRSEAQRVFAERLDACWPRVAQLGLPRPAVTVRRMKTRWGSCSARGRILLNLRLIQAPLNAIDYVFVHELCHLKEHNHSKRYYGLLSGALPDWRERQRAALAS